MKYFVNAAERAASGHKNYIEFQKTHPAKDFWDAESLYLSEEVMDKSGFGKFWNECAAEHGFVFTDTIYAADWAIMACDAKRIGSVILDVVNELSPWLEEQYAAGAPYVGVVRAFDRALEQRRCQREEYPVDPNFYAQVSEIDDTLPASKVQEEYERLLRKYNMPSCFFPLSLDEPGK